MARWGRSVEFYLSNHFKFRYLYRLKMEGTTVIVKMGRIGIFILGWRIRGLCFG